MSFVREFRALGLLTWRSTIRKAFRGGIPRAGLGPAAMRLLLVAYTYGYTIFIYARVAGRIAQRSSGRVSATAFLLSAPLFNALLIAAVAQLAPTFKKTLRALGGVRSCRGTSASASFAERLALVQGSTVFTGALIDPHLSGTEPRARL